ncbi:MAG: divergent polysaccharide deacetylase family protein [Mariprofundus sp.]|nr:divergent polysaccharide deacetylase family protein [Mariprofundus sp.]
MPQKKKIPFWPGLVLAAVLVTLLAVIFIVPQTENETEQSSVQMPEKQPVQTPVREPSPQAIEPTTKAPSIGQVIEALPPEEALPAIRVAHGLALIIDDVGYNISALKRVLALSVPVAISVLPEGPFAGKSAKLAHQAGQVVMLHLPMQPIDPSLQMSESFLLEGMSEDVIRETFQRDIDRVPFVEGVNNHMGSKLTQLEMPMRQVMQLCREKGLFFVDSKTSSGSIAATMAKKMGLNWASRRFFLDHIMSSEAMLHEWERARACVRKGRRCIIIAHPRAASVAFLENNLTEDDAANMVSIRQLLKGKSRMELPQNHALEEVQ